MSNGEIILINMVAALRDIAAALWVSNAIVGCIAGLTAGRFAWDMYMKNKEAKVGKPRR